MNDGGDGNDERSKTLSNLLGVRDEAAPCREATAGEMEVVAIALYSYFVTKYLEGDDTGLWERWHEENGFPRHEFQSHSSRTNNGVFGGFDFNERADQNLENGFEGVKAVALVGPRKKKTMIWEAESCGDGLKRKITQGIGEKISEQGAMRQTVCGKMKKDIYTQEGYLHPSRTFYSGQTLSMALVYASFRPTPS